MSDSQQTLPLKSLSSGMTLGRYQLIGKIGAGGMGEVWSAEDKRLHRKVALKMLAPEVALDPERRVRFEREAKAAAALNHPNIITLHSVEEEDGRLFLAMELIEGRPLNELIPPGGLRLSRFLDYAVPLAQAVGAAHLAGITHRDLKPQNVMVTHDERLKVLDFGLAKIGARFDSDGAALEAMQTVTSRGQIVGTVAYMSPEQAQGTRVDPRSDVFSLGVVMFEMATGRRPFTGESQISVLSSVLKDEPPPVSTLNSAMPPELDRIIRRCLIKDARRRYQTAVDLANDLEELRPPSGGLAAAPAPAQRQRRWLLRAAALVALVAAAALAVRASRLGARAPAPSIALFTQLTSDEGGEGQPSVSPDGTWFVYASYSGSSSGIYRQRVGGENAQNLTADSKGSDRAPAISPDGELIAFSSDRDKKEGIFVMGATGESVRRLTDLGSDPAWTPDGRELVFSSEASGDPRYLGTGYGQLYAVKLSGGKPRALPTSGAAMRPRVSPHGVRVVYWTADGHGQRDLWTVRLEGGSEVQLTNDAALDFDPVWSPDGRFVYFASDRGGYVNLWRIPVDEASGRALGSPEPVTLAVARWSYGMSFSADGSRLLFVSEGADNFIEKIRFDPIKEQVTGQSTRLAQGEMPAARGNVITYVRTGLHEDLEIISPDGKGRRQLTNDGFRNRRPRLSPDGGEIAFYSNRGGGYECWSIRSDGSGLRQLTESGKMYYPTWSPDMRRMASCSDTTAYIFALDRGWKEQQPKQLPLLGKGSFCPTDWSPDGRMVVGMPSNVADSGLWIYLVDKDRFRRFDLVKAPASERQDVGFPHFPTWLSDSRRIIYGHDGKIVLIDTTSGQQHVVMEQEHDSISFASLSPDDQWIYFERYHSDADIWMATLK